MIILFNADDFGLTEGVTDGIIKAHTDGIIRSTTMIMNGHACDYAITQAKENPTLQVGIHLVLTWGIPLNKHVPNLVNDQGAFKYTNRFEEMDPPPIDQVEKEWQTQIEAFLATGLPLHHIDSHHHIHGWLPLKEVVMRLAKKYDVPVRYVDSLKDYPEYLLTETLWTQFYADGVTDGIFSELRRLDVRSVEVMTHPAFVDQDLREISSYTKQRETELKILCHVDIPDWVDLVT